MKITKIFLIFFSGKIHDSQYFPVGLRSQIVSKCCLTAILIIGMPYMEKIKQKSDDVIT